MRKNNCLPDTDRIYKKSYESKLSVYENWKIPSSNKVGGFSDYGTEVSNSISVGSSETGGKFFYHSDHLGSTSYITNFAGEVTQHHEYIPFGETFVSEYKNAGYNSPYRFNSKEFDSNTGFYYYGARYYNPKTSLWISVDPMMLRDDVFDDPDSTNGGVLNNFNLSVYSFSYNSPVKYVDPDGECPNCVTAGAGLLIGGFLGGGIEAGMQLYSSGKITSWKAVLGASTQGAITGTMAGLTAGASLATTVAVGAGANVAGGYANRRIQNKNTRAKDVVIDFALGGAIGFVGYKLNNLLRGFSSSATGNAMSSQVGKLAEKLNIYSAQSSLKPNGGRQIVENYLKQMEAGTFNKAGGGYIDKTGRIIISEGNHSMNAALEYSIKTGDGKYVEFIINKGNFIKNVNLSDYGVKAKPLPTE